jgi:hypothetical protein
LLAGTALLVAVVAVGLWRGGLISEDGPQLPTIEEVRKGPPYRTYYFEAQVTWGSTEQGPLAQSMLIRGW